IHYPTDSALVGDGVRVLTRVMKKVAAVAGTAGTSFRDRSRSVKRRILEIAYAARDKSAKGQAKIKVAYFLRRQRSRGQRTGLEASGCSQPLHQKRETETGPKEALVQESSEVADRLRRPYQYPETAAPAESVPIQRHSRNATLGRSRCHGR